jgi:hypothetical protein
MHSCEHGNKPLGSVKGRESIEGPSDSHGLCYMDLLSYTYCTVDIRNR